MKINIFLGELTDVSATKEALVLNHFLFSCTFMIHNYKGNCAHCAQVCRNA